MPQRKAAAPAAVTNACAAHTTLVNARMSATSWHTRCLNARGSGERRRVGKRPQGVARRGTSAARARRPPRQPPLQRRHERRRVARGSSAATAWVCASSYKLRVEAPQLVVAPPPPRNKSHVVCGPLRVHAAGAALHAALHAARRAARGSRLSRP